MAKKSKVAVLYTTPETVLEDYDRLFKLAEIDKYLDKKKPTILKFKPMYIPCKLSDKNLLFESVLSRIFGLCAIVGQITICCIPVVVCPFSSI